MILTLHPQASRRRIHVVIDSLDASKGWEVEIREHRSRRSTAQNRLLWAWHGELQRHLGEAGQGWHDAETIHEYIVRALLPLHAIEIDGEVMQMRASTRRLRVAEFTDLLRRYEEMARDKWGLDLPRHDGIYDIAMGGPAALGD